MQATFNCNLYCRRDIQDSPGRFREEAILPGKAGMASGRNEEASPLYDWPARFTALKMWDESEREQGGISVRFVKLLTVT